MNAEREPLTKLTDARREYSEEIFPKSMQIAAPENPTTKAPANAKILRMPKVNNIIVASSPITSGTKKFFLRLACDALRQGM